MARVWTCLDPPLPDGQTSVGTYCENAQFVEMSSGTSSASPWPQLTVDQGLQIGQAWLLALVAVACIRIFLSPKLHS